MASKKKQSFGKPFRKKGNGGKFRRGELVRYVYVNGKRVGTVRARNKK